MILFPNCKINLGLAITEKRPDGYHTLETVFYPLHLSEPLEIIPSETTVFTSSGIAIPGESHQNLCIKAYELMAKYHQLPPVHIHLHKHIPIGAGLGGGSSDAAYTLLLLNHLFQLNLTTSTLEDYARLLGSDCAFFIQNTPVFAKEKGDIFEPIPIDLSDYHLVLLKPDIHISTAEAYGGISSYSPLGVVKRVIQQPISTWKEELINDFEQGISAKHPLIADIKQMLYQKGAIYAAMSGSGSSVFGLFSAPIHLNDIPKDYFYWQGKLGKPRL